jgi:serine O-acetyltransferase
MLKMLIKSDIARFAEESEAFQTKRAGFIRQLGILLTPAVSSCALHRLAHSLHVQGYARLSRSVAAFNSLFHRILIEPSSSIGPGLYIPHPPGIVFSGVAGTNLRLYTHAIVGPVDAPIHSALLHLCPRLGDEVAVGMGALIIGAIEIGDRIQVAPGAVVREPIPSDSTIIAPHVLAKKVKTVPA